MKKIFVLGLCVLMLLAGCSSNSSSSAANSDSKKEEVVGVQIANPWAEVESLAAASDITGFGINVPEVKDDTLIQVMDSKLIEVIYHENGEETYRVRKAAGNEDVSGDYNNYEKEETVEIGNYTVTLKGNGDTYSLATWTYDGYTYAVSCNGLSLEEITDIISTVN